MQLPTNHAASRQSRTMQSGKAEWELDLLCFSHLALALRDAAPAAPADALCAGPARLLLGRALFRRGRQWGRHADAGSDARGSSRNLWVLRPHLPRAGNADEMQRESARRVYGGTLQGGALCAVVLHADGARVHRASLRAEATVYDCMDELTGFLGGAAWSWRSGKRSFLRQRMWCLPAA